MRSGRRDRLETGADAGGSDQMVELTESASAAVADDSVDDRVCRSSLVELLTSGLRKRVLSVLLRSTINVLENPIQSAQAD